MVSWQGKTVWMEASRESSQDWSGLAPISLSDPYPLRQVDNPGISILHLEDAVLHQELAAQIIQVGRTHVIGSLQEGEGEEGEGQERSAGRPAEGVCVAQNSASSVSCVLCLQAP